VLHSCGEREAPIRLTLHNVLMVRWLADLHTIPA